MARFILQKISYYVLSLTVLVCLCTCDTANVIDAHFKTSSCDNPKFHTILKMVPAKTTTAYSVIHCAVLCHQTVFCTYAIFDNRNKTCEHIYGVSNTFRPINEEYSNDHGISNTKCKVLTKVMTETWTRVEMEQLIALKGYDDFSVLKYDKPNAAGTRHQVFSVSQFSVNETKGFTVATSGKILSVVLKKEEKFSKSYRNKFYFAYSDLVHVNLDVNYINLNDGQIKNALEDKRQGETCVRKHLKLESEVKLADSFQDVLLLLMRGARRLMRHPATIIIFDPPTKEISFDITETTLIELPGVKPPQPLYFKSIKETYNEGLDCTRYVLKHQMLGDDEEAYEKTEITDSGPLAFETNWLQMSPIDIQPVKNAARLGIPVRMYVLGDMFTDANMIYITPDDIMVSLTSFIRPFKGNDASQNNHYIFFPLFRESDKTYIECQSSTMKGNGPFTLAKNVIHHSSIWFVGKKTWIQLYAVDHDGQMLSGTLQALKEYIVRGEDIRVCVEETSQTVYCFNTQFVNTMLETHDSLFQSYPFVDPSEVFSGDAVTTCPPQKVMLISSDGWVKTVEFNAGYPDIDEERLSFAKMSFFAERD